MTAADPTDMAHSLTRQNLHGIWVAIATPFDDHYCLDEAAFRENIRRLHAAGIHGIYTTDSDGEFYAIELDEFKRIVDVFADETQRLGFPTIAACRRARDLGCPRRPSLLHANDARVLPRLLERGVAGRARVVWSDPLQHATVRQLPARTRLCRPAGRSAEPGGHQAGRQRLYRSSLPSCSWRPGSATSPASTP